MSALVTVLLQAFDDCLKMDWDSPQSRSCALGLVTISATTQHAAPYEPTYSDGARGRVFEKLPDERLALEMRPSVGRRDSQEVLRSVSLSISHRHLVVTRLCRPQTSTNSRRSPGHGPAAPRPSRRRRILQSRPSREEKILCALPTRPD